MDKNKKANSCTESKERMRMLGHECTTAFRE